jgi:hypothetical protein
MRLLQYAAKQSKAQPHLHEPEVQCTTFQGQVGEGALGATQQHYIIDKIYNRRGAFTNAGCRYICLKHSKTLRTREAFASVKLHTLGGTVTRSGNQLVCGLLSTAPA